MYTKGFSYLTILFVLMLTSIVGCTPVKQISKGDTPAIQFEQVTYNFGKIKRGQKVVYDFKFKNVGGDKLVINNVQSSCGCTVALASSNELLPGASGVIKATFDSTNYIGPVTKTITVTDNDPQKPVVTLNLTGEVITDIMTDKPALFFGSIKKGKKSQQDITIFISNPGTEITAVTVTRPYIKLTEINRQASQETYNVTISPNAEPGPINGEIIIYSTSKEQPIVRVPIIGIVVK
ncbi:MAG: DUF1573 domain-containing protein [bacterium]